MKKLLTLSITAALFFVFSTPLLAGDRAIDGMVIGGGAGAIVGQAIGRNMESTLIGATVGSVLGLIVGSETHIAHYRPTIRERGYRHHKKRHYRHSRHYRSGPKGRHSGRYYSRGPTPRRHHYKKNKRRHYSRNRW